MSVRNLILIWDWVCALYIECFLSVVKSRTSASQSWAHSVHSVNGCFSLYWFPFGPLQGFDCRHLPLIKIELKQGWGDDGSFNKVTAAQDQSSGLQNLPSKPGVTLGTCNPSTKGGRVRTACLASQWKLRGNKGGEPLWRYLTPTSGLWVHLRPHVHSHMHMYTYSYGTSVHNTYIQNYVKDFIIEIGYRNNNTVFPIFYYGEYYIPHIILYNIILFYYPCLPVI